MARVLVVATSRKTRGGITSVVKAHETGGQWKKFHCIWIQTHRDGSAWRKILYFVTAMIQYCFLLPVANIVHIHVATIQSAKRKRFFYKLAKFYGKKVIFHFHPSNEKFLYEPVATYLYRDLFGGADKVIVLSEQWKRWIKDSLGDGKWMDKMEVLYNPCPIVRRDYSLKRNQILYAGTLLRRKGYDVLLKAFANIAKKYPNWKVIFAGNPYLKDGFDELEDGRRIARECHIVGQVEWLGWIEGKEKERVFNESSIYCLASDGEGFPMGVLDAWAYALPCVVTPVGGIPDFVRDGKEGLIFPVGDAESLSIALDRMIRDSDLRQSIVEATDKYVNDIFNVDRINQRLGEIYESLC